MYTFEITFANAKGLHTLIIQATGYEVAKLHTETLGNFIFAEQIETEFDSLYIH